MGLKGTAAIVGAAQYKPEKYATAPQMFHLEQVADLAAQALADAGLKASDIDGLCINGPHFHEASSFVPAMAAEYLGVALNFAEVVDLGGTTAVGMIWRAAAAIELGICQAVLCVIPQRSEEHTSELQSRPHLVCRLLLEKKKTYRTTVY